MAIDKDIALVEYLLRHTRTGAIKWEPTAETRAEQYTTSFNGKYTVIINSSLDVGCWLDLKDTDNRNLMTITASDYPPVNDLFSLVKRASLNVDAAIDEIINDIPF